eukprot:2159065-Pyramimonas_sp.AAC.1
MFTKYEKPQPRRPTMPPTASGAPALTAQLTRPGRAAASTTQRVPAAQPAMPQPPQQQQGLGG